MRTLEVAQLAGDQHGVVSRRQLLETGLTEGQISRWLQRGRLIRMHSAVYAVGHDQLTPTGRRLAAVLTCGPAASLSHRSAAAHWGLLHTYGALIDVSAPRSRGGSRGVRIHRPRKLDPLDRTEHSGVPITTVSRTLIDLAAVVRFGILERAFKESLVLQLLDMRELDGALARAGAKRGVRAVRTLAEQQAPQITRSSLERALLKLIRRHGVAEPQCNSIVNGWEVDFLWSEQRIIVETDGERYHSDVLALHRDRERDRDLQLAGYRVLRFDGRDIRDRPGTVISQINSALFQFRAA